MQTKTIQRLSSIFHYLRGHYLRLVFSDSPGYWEKRYRRGGNSGAGSYGRLSDYKAKFINTFIEKHKIQSVVDYGCGDGHQMSLLKISHYCGLDVSVSAIAKLRKKYSHDKSKQFFVVSEWSGLVNPPVELAMSLDVIYHLVEDSLYEKYLMQLFSGSQKYVIIYSSNSDEIIDPAPHVKHHCVTNWVQAKAPAWRLIHHDKNPYPYDPSDPMNTSSADFFVFENGN